jgi:hypothetical protein
VKVGITAPQRDVLTRLAGVVPDGTYLAGGVAVALRLGHRQSLDLDLFVPSDFDVEQLAERLTIELTSVAITGRARGTLHLEIEQLPVSVILYRYPLIVEPAVTESSAVPVASLPDLACMKLSAIAGRGAAKDFWDLDEMLRNQVADGSLSKALDLYAGKFASADPGHVLRSLAYFAEADAARLPAGLDDVHWGEIKARFVERVRAADP